MTLDKNSIKCALYEFPWGGLIFQSFSVLRVTRVCFFPYKESSNELPIMDLEQLSTLYQSSFHFFPSHIFFFF